eukprot:2631983-Pyramimonas_sp.AAC.1
MAQGTPAFPPMVSSSALDQDCGIGWPIRQKWKRPEPATLHYTPTPFATRNQEAATRGIP